MKLIKNFINSMSKLKYNQQTDTINMQLEETQIEEMENIDEPKKYQWIKGDNFGDIAIVKAEDNEFIYFTNGEQIYKNLVREFLQEITNNELPLPSFNDGVSLKPAQPQQIAQKQSANYELVKIEEPVVKETPLEKLILKLSQKNVESINVKLGINIPKKEVVEMLIENSDESRTELLEAITKMAVAQITIDKLQEFIKEEINSYLNNYYNE